MFYFCSFPLDPKFLEPKDWPVCQPIVSECSELPTNLHATKALTDLPVSVGQKVTMACARKGMIIIQNSNLDIANKSVKPFLFTIFNNSLSQM